VRLAALSVDLDEIPCYTAIHGLPPPNERAAHAIYEKAIARFARVFADEGIHGSFFAIGSDLGSEENSERIAALARAGHEIGNHTLHHRYDLTRLSPQSMRDEIRGGMDAIERACGARPAGFRAPGYTVTDELLAIAHELGALYDSSVFPCPPYFFAKIAAIGAIRLYGRTSESIVSDPRVLRSPADPYRIGSPYWKRGGGLLELPIGVTRGARLPYIGTTVVLAGAIGARVLTRTICGRPLVNLELHGIDLSDAREDGLAFLAPYRADLRTSAAAKENALRSAVATLREAGYRFVTLREAAEQCST
jgi:hypothetical protein